MATATITNGVLTKLKGDPNFEIQEPKPLSGYFSDPDAEASYRKDADWFNTYISHIRKRRRKAVKGTRISLDDDSEDDELGYGKSGSGNDKLRRKTFYEKQLDKKSRSKVSEAPDRYWTYFRQFGGPDSQPSPNEGRYSEMGMKRIAEEKEKKEQYRSAHSHKDLFGAEEYYRSGRDILYRMWQERENLKEKDKQLKNELGYDEREMELGAPRLVHESREVSLRYATPLHNPNSQQLVRTILSEPMRPLSAANQNQSQQTQQNNLSKYTLGTGVDLTRVTSQRAADARNLSANQKLFEIPNIDEYDDRENMVQSSMVKQKLDAQSRKVETLYDTIRSLEREKSNQEATLQDLREDVRTLRDRMEFTGGRTNSENSVNFVSNSRQLDAFKNEFMEQFAKMQQQINGLSSNQGRSMKNEELVSSLVSDIGDIKKMFRDEITTLKQEMEDVKSQNRKMAAAFESNASQMKEFQRKLTTVEKRCDEVSVKNSKFMKDSFVRDATKKSSQPDEGVDRGKGITTAPEANFEIQDLRSALLRLDDRMKSIECKDEVGARDKAEQWRKNSGERGFEGKLGRGSDSDVKRNWRGVYGDDDLSDEDRKYYGKEAEKKSSIVSDQVTRRTLLTESDVELSALNREPTSSFRGSRVNSTDHKSSTTPGGLGSAEDLLLLTEEMAAEGFGAETDDITVSNFGSLDDLSTF